MDLGLAGKVVLITGAAGGVGPTLAGAFAREGGHVALHVRDASVRGRAHDAAEEIEGAGGRATVVGADLRLTDAVDAMVRTVGDRLGPVAVLVNNETQVITISGIVRPQDVTGANTVRSAKAVFMTHGEDEAALALAARVAKERGLATHVPEMGESVQL